MKKRCNKIIHYEETKTVVIKAPNSCPNRPARMHQQCDNDREMSAKKLLLGLLLPEGNENTNPKNNA